MQCKDSLIYLKTSKCKWEYDETFVNGKFKGFNNYYFAKMVVISSLVGEGAPLFIMTNYFNETLENPDDESSIPYYY